MIVRILISVTFWILLGSLPLYAGVSVRDLQANLVAMGYDPGPVDGLMGRKTKSAVAKFYADRAKPFSNEIDASTVKFIADELDKHPIKYCKQTERYVDNKDLVDDSFTINQYFSAPIKTRLPLYQEGTQGLIIKDFENKDIGPIILAVSDANADGIDDILIEYIETLVPPQLFFGTNEGKFVNSNAIPASAERRHVRQGHFVDFNNDSYPDFVGFTTSDHTEYFEEEGAFFEPGEKDLILINNEGHSFFEVELPEVHQNDINHGGLVADLNADGLNDLISFSEADGLETFPHINLGGGTFEIAKNALPAIVTQNWIEDGAAGDLNNDNFVDLVVTIQNPSSHKVNPADANTLLVLYGNGEPNTSDSPMAMIGNYWYNEEDLVKYLDAATEEYGEKFSRRDLEFGTGYVTILDINSDGKLDIFEAQFLNAPEWRTSGFKVYLNEEDCFVDRTAKLFPNQYINRRLETERQTMFVNKVYFSDLNQDGKKDVLIQATHSEHWRREQGTKQFPYIFLQQRDGSFFPANTVLLGGLPDLGDMVTGDFNGDGVTDISGIHFNGDRTAIHTYLAKPIR